jgi:hypothetical protein
MPAELDHVFVWVSASAPEAEGLVALGLREGQSNRHPGQGTACRRFVIANRFLELVWVENPEEAQGQVARPLRLWERWTGRGAGACPFGVILRPAGPGDAAPPFPAWEYRPPYLPPPLTLHVGRNAACLEEPLLFYFQGLHRPDALLMQDGERLEHGVGFRELTALRIFSPHAATVSPAMQAAEQTSALGFHQGAEYLAEIGFDGEVQGRRADLRPALPLVLCW